MLFAWNKTAWIIIISKLHQIFFRGEALWVPSPKIINYSYVTSPRYPYYSPEHNESLNQHYFDYDLLNFINFSG